MRDEFRRCEVMPAQTEEKAMKNDETYEAAFKRRAAQHTAYCNGSYRNDEPAVIPYEGTVPYDPGKVYEERRAREDAENERYMTNVRTYLNLGPSFTEPGFAAKHGEYITASYERRREIDEQRENEARARRNAPWLYTPR
jgi:hypothetical protein